MDRRTFAVERVEIAHEWLEVDGGDEEVESILTNKNEGRNTSELTESEKLAKKIKSETGWSDDIICCIKNEEQYSVYKKADLHEEIIDGRKCLVKNIDLDYINPKTKNAKFPNGQTNRDLMAKGRSPYDSKTGELIELHHIGQEYESPFAELCENSEHGDGNDGILHDKKKESWRNDSKLKKQYNNVDRPNHWKRRYK